MSDNYDDDDQSFEGDTVDIFDTNVYSETYRTNDVAKLLNETPAMIRYYCSTFKDFIPIEQKEKGAHRRFTNENVEMLRKIIDMRREGKAVKEILHYLNSLEGIVETVEFNNQEVAAQKLADYFTEYMLKNFSSEIDNALSQVKLDNNEVFKNIYEQMQVENDKERQAYQVEIENLNQRIDQLTEHNNKILEHTTEVLELLEEQNSKKKKGLFGIFKKD